MVDDFPALDAVIASLASTLQFTHVPPAPLLDTKVVAEIIQRLKHLLFPAHFPADDAAQPQAFVTDTAHLLARQISMVLPSADAPARESRW